MLTRLSEDFVYSYEMFRIVLRLTRLVSHQTHDSVHMPCDKASNASKAQLNPCVAWKVIVARKTRLGFSGRSTDDASKAIVISALLSASSTSGGS